MKLATVLAAATFALLGASAASAQNSLNAVQSNVNGNNVVKNRQVSPVGNFAGIDQSNVNGNNIVKNRQVTGRKGVNDGQVFQGNVNGNNVLKNRQIQRGKF